jgi:anaerobic selenocysteine-containing dehydrogenase
MIPAGWTSGIWRVSTNCSPNPTSTSKAWKWLPIKPGTEAALAMAMIRWIIENRRYDARYLTNANKGAAKADGEPTWCNATWLVVLDEKCPEHAYRQL